jgi:hypothetical protein
MDELIGRVTSALGVDENLAKVSVGHVLAFLQKEFPDGPVAELVAKLPGSQEAIDAAAAADQSGAGGLLGGLMSSAGGLMGLAGKLNGAGLDMGQIQSLAKVFFSHAEEVIGKENVEKIAGSIPGLSQFL